MTGLSGSLWLNSPTTNSSGLHQTDTLHAQHWQTSQAGCGTSERVQNGVCGCLCEEDVGSDIASHMYISSHTPAYVSLVHCGQSSVSESEVLSADYLPILSLRIGPSSSLLFYLLFHPLHSFIPFFHTSHAQWYIKCVVGFVRMEAWGRGKSV